MKANAEPHLLSSLVLIDSGVVVSQHRLELFFHEIKCNGMTSFMEFTTAITTSGQPEAMRNSLNFNLYCDMMLANVCEH